MKRPVLVIHGVDNRDKDVFTQTVQKLGLALGGESFNLIPVFWGDLGAQVDTLGDTVPQLPSGGRRGAPDAEQAAALVFAADIEASAAPRPTRRGTGAPWEVVAEGAEQVLDGAGTGRRRGDAADVVRDAVSETWANTRWLHNVEAPATLEAIGRALGRAVQQQEEPAGTGRRWNPLDSLKDYAKGVIAGLDESVGAALGSTLGDLNTALRSNYAPGLMRFLGDGFIYESNRDAIQKRLWEALDQFAPGYGTQEQPIDVFAHSFGGLVSFDAAVAAARTLYIKGYVTFGSQPAFFYVLGPRRPGLPAYAAGKPVRLPPSIARWTNLWEPMDPLAFLAGKVFVLDSGQAPTDIMVPHRVSSGWWTHSVYWTTPELVQAIRDTLR